MNCHHCIVTAGHFSLPFGMDALGKTLMVGSFLPVFFFMYLFRIWPPIGSDAQKNAQQKGGAAQ